ncbi:MAG: universal stress protein [Bacteroidia bacterium]|nr:universal stress protein [Bacteroidia bacterium]MCZ2277840.1 universal stress protein [Bacteroidia bacterium]
MKTILCPVDFSRNSRDAYTYALEMANKFKAGVIALHCFETPVVFTEFPLGPIPVGTKELYESAQKRLKKFISGIRIRAAKSVKVDLIILQGLASSRIIEIALEKKADMIIMGSTGTSAVARILMGSNSLRVIRNAPCPVFTIPKGIRFKPMKKIVYSTDLQDDNLRAANGIVPLAKAFGAEIMFLNIDNRLLMNDEKDYQKMKKKIAAAVKYRKVSGYVSTQLNIVKGMTEFIRKTNPSCLAMYSRQHGFISKLTGASTTEKAALNIKIPLLSLPERH